MFLLERNLGRKNRRRMADTVTSNRKVNVPRLATKHKGQMMICVIYLNTSWELFVIVPCGN